MRQTSILPQPRTSSGGRSIAGRLPGALGVHALSRHRTINIISANRAAHPGTVILVAEDHLDSRDALRTLLEALGYVVAVAGDGRQAVASALDLHPSLILMDVMMPEMDGLDATRMLRREAEMGDVPIVALTALEGARERVIEAGCDDYITKPIDLPSFLKKLEKWLAVGRLPT